MKGKSCIVIGVACVGLMFGCSKSDNADEPEKSKLKSATSHVLPAASYREHFEVRMLDLSVSVSQEGTDLKGTFDWERDLIFDVQRGEGGDTKRVVVARMDDQKRTEFSGYPRATEREDRPLVAKTLLGERKQGAWTFMMEGVSPEPEQQRALTEIAVLEGWMEAFYPAEAIEVGDEWKVAPSGVQRWLGPNLSSASGSIDMKAVSLETYEGRECVKIGATIEVKGMLSNQEEGELEVTFSGIAEFLRSVELGLDLSVRLVGDITLQASDPKLESRMVMQGPLEAIESRIIGGNR